MTTSADTNTLAGLREELRLIGCHQNGDARCTCAIGADALDAIDALRAQQPAAPVSGVAVQEAGWQPIDTAPRDGAWVLLHGLCEIPCIDAGSPETVMAYWTNHNGGGWVWHGAVAMTFTHWLPLPEPPDLSALEGK